MAAILKRYNISFYSIYFLQNYMFYRAYLYGANFIANFRWESGFLWVLGSGGIKGGGMGHFPPPSLRPCPPLSPQSEAKKWSKSAIFGKFLNFCPLRNAFFPLDAPHKTFLVPPLVLGTPLGHQRE